MKRREFIAGLGSAAAWPVVARAQQPAMPVIGFLSTGRKAGLQAAERDAGFRKGLAEAGFVEDHNVTVEYRFADGQIERLPQLAADLVNRKVAVIVTNSTFGVPAAKAATTTIPIVFFTGGDLVELGFVASYNRPGENLTAIAVFTNEIWTKRVELTRELVPAVSLLGMLVNPNNVVTGRAVREAQEAVRLTGQQLLIVSGNTAAAIDDAFLNLVRDRAGALLVQDETAINNQREQILVLAAHYRIPGAYPFPEWARDGGLMSYGPSLVDAWRQVGAYAGRLLKGAHPADLPVVVPNKFDLVINLKTAKALGLTIPETLLATADEVIQ
jgi:putative ABC transport system substrate-binding protein